MLDRVAGRLAVSLLALILSERVFAVGLGDMRGQPVLGESIKLEVALLGVEKQKLDAACFRLAQPASSDGLPWLSKAAMAVRGGASPVLEIRTEAPLREPLMQLTLRLGCGHEVSRDYILMASPATVREAAPLAAPVATASALEKPGVAPVERRTPRVRPPAPAAAVDEEAPVKLTPRNTVRRAATAAMQDRLVLSGEEGISVGEPSLRLATELRSSAAAKESQRDILRLEFRMLMALHDQAASQMATAEKLRNMEGTLGELQARAAQFAQRVETEAVASPSPAPAVQTAATAPKPDSAPVTAARPASNPALNIAESDFDTPWTLYGLALGVLFGLSGWFGWRKYREAREFQDDGAIDDLAPLAIPEARVDPRRVDENDEQASDVDLHFEPVEKGGVARVDLDLDLGDKAAEEAQVVEQPAEKACSRGPDSVLSISATTLDEHFEANPVMELADIMLSFGRVKGAAQALQEFIDHNPEEALRPWIRLMDVYRMAGMRAEFETVARDLNRHFNVEVQSWDAPASEDSNGAATVDQVLAEYSRSASLEEMPRLMNTVVAMWAEGDIVGYLYQLLRDNRGGQRQGFALSVVEDILFLIELKETANRME